MADSIDHIYKNAGEVLKYLSRFPLQRFAEDIAKDLEYDINDVSISLGLLQGKGLLTLMERDGPDGKEFVYGLNRKRLEWISSLTLPAMKYLKMV